MRTTFAMAAAAAVLLAAPVTAQDHQHHQHHAGHHTAGQMPEGWHVRVDRDQPADAIMFHAMDDHFHARTGPAGVFYNPGWQKSGNYAISARFRQNRAPAHPEAYGLVIGGTRAGRSGPELRLLPGARDG
jgi:hypothetical protein